MPTQNKRFTVFGDAIEILVDGKTSHGSIAVLTQTSPPGGGPPRHRHTYEDETFVVLDGEFEVFDGADWRPLPQGEVFFTRRGDVHTFRNSGFRNGTMLVFVAPAGFEQYLEELSPFSFPLDADRIVAISKQYGISFVS